MKRTMLFVLALPLLLGAAPALQEDVRSMPSCSLCKMSREKYDFSRVVLKLKDGTALGTCSITCATVELARHGEDRVASILVADLRSKELIDARSAFWVMGGARRGVMTNVPKWAFAAEEEARTFSEEFGGNRATFEEVLTAAASDTRTKLGLK